MRLTKETRHALDALTFLAARPRGTIVEAAVLADNIDVPHAFMSKILQRLAKARMVAGHRGNPRGYSLAVEPKRLAVGRVLEEMEGDVFARCIFFSNQCSDVDSCPLHRVWKKIRPMARTMMNDLTVADLAARK